MDVCTVGGRWEGLGWEGWGVPLAHWPADERLLMHAVSWGVSGGVETLAMSWVNAGVRRRSLQPNAAAVLFRSTAGPLACGRAAPDARWVLGGERGRGDARHALGSREDQETFAAAECGSSTFPEYRWPIGLRRTSPDPRHVLEVERGRGDARHVLGSRESQETLAAAECGSSTFLNAAAALFSRGAPDS